jgi:hypothetical protein
MRVKQTIIISISLWAMTCARDITAEPLQGNPDEAVQMDFIMHVTGKLLPGSRTNGTYPESAISTLNVLAFEIETNEDREKETYHHISSAIKVDGDHNDNGESRKTSFTVRLFKSDKPHRLPSLANLNPRKREQFSHVAENKNVSKETVPGHLAYALEPPGEGWPAGAEFPMWTGTTVPSVDDTPGKSGLTGGSLKLMCAMADSGDRHVTTTRDDNARQTLQPRVTCTQPMGSDEP